MVRILRSNASWSGTRGPRATIAWRTTGSAAPYSLQRQQDGGTFITVLSYLTSPNVFTYTDNDSFDANPVDQVSIQLSLGTKTTTVVLRSDVELHGEGLTSVGDFAIEEGDTASFILT